MADRPIARRRADARELRDDLLINRSGSADAGAR
jgi:hypothetical protein